MLGYHHCNQTEEKLKFDYETSTRWNLGNGNIVLANRMNAEKQMQCTMGIFTTYSEPSSFEVFLLFETANVAMPLIQEQKHFVEPEMVVKPLIVQICYEMWSKPLIMQCGKNHLLCICHDIVVQPLIMQRCNANEKLVCNTTKSYNQFN